MSAYLNLVLNKKILATTKVGDGTDVREQAERMISNLHHFVDIEEGRHEVIDLPLTFDPRTPPDWITPLRIVVTAEAPQGRKIKKKGRIAPDRWIGVRDYHVLINKFVQPFSEALTNAFVEGRDVSNDSHINEQLATCFDALLEHCGLPSGKLAKAFVLPAPYAWRCEGSGVRIVSEREGPASSVAASPHSITLH